MIAKKACPGLDPGWVSVFGKGSCAIAHDPERWAPVFRPRSCANTARRQYTGDARSVLRLLCGLVDAHLDREHLTGTAVARAAQRGRAKVVEPDRDPHMGVGGADAVGGIERHPAQIGHE